MKDANQNKPEQIDIDQQKKLLSRGNTNKVLTNLADYLETRKEANDWKNELTHLSGRYHRLLREIRLGTITQSQENQQMNQITQSLIYFLDNLVDLPSKVIPEQDAQVDEVPNKTFNKPKEVKKSDNGQAFKNRIAHHLEYLSLVQQEILQSAGPERITLKIDRNNKRKALLTEHQVNLELFEKYLPDFKKKLLQMDPEFELWLEEKGWSW